MNSPARALRIDEVLRQKIASGKKITLREMGELQQDVVDVFARKISPMLIEMAREVLPSMTEQ